MEYFILISIEDLQTMGFLPEYPSDDLPDDEYSMSQREYTLQTKFSNLMAMWPNIARRLDITPNINNLDRVYISNEDEVGWCFNI